MENYQEVSAQCSFPTIFIKHLRVSLQHAHNILQTDKSTHLKTGLLSRSLWNRVSVKKLCLEIQYSKHSTIYRLSVIKKSGNVALYKWLTIYNQEKVRKT